MSHHYVSPDGKPFCHPCYCGIYFVMSEVIHSEGSPPHKITKRHIDANGDYYECVWTYAPIGSSEPAKKFMELGRDWLEREERIRKDRQ